MYLEIGFHGPLRFAPPEILQPALANLLGINHNRIPQDTPLFAQVQWIPSFRAITTSGQCVHVDAMRIAGMKAGLTMLSSVRVCFLVIINFLALNHFFFNTWIKRKVSNTKVYCRV